MDPPSPTTSAPRPTNFWGPSAPNAIEHLVTKIKHNQLRSLYLLPNQTLTVEQYDQLFAALIESNLRYTTDTQLTTVSLGPIPKCQAHQLSKYISTSYNLDQLIIKDDLVPYLNGFKAMPHAVQLTKLAVATLDSTQDSRTVLTDLLGLVKASLLELQMDRTRCPVLGPEHQLTELRKLDLSNAELDSVAYSSWVEGCPNLVELYVGGNAGLKVHAGSALPELKYVDLSELDISDSQLTELMKTVFPNISALKLSGTQISGVKQVHGHHLKFLDVSRCPVVPSAFSAPNTLFTCACKDLEELNLSECSGGLNHRSVVQVLLNFPSLKSLCVRGIDLSGMQVGDLVGTRCQRLEEFDLTSTQISYAVMVMMIEELRSVIIWEVGMNGICEETEVMCELESRLRLENKRLDWRI